MGFCGYEEASQKEKWQEIRSLAVFRGVLVEGTSISDLYPQGTVVSSTGSVYTIMVISVPLNGK